MYPGHISGYFQYPVDKAIAMEKPPSFFEASHVFEGVISIAMLDYVGLPDFRRIPLGGIPIRSFPCCFFLFVAFSGFSQCSETPTLI